MESKVKKMNRILGIVLVSLILSVVPALSADVKVGYVDLQKALNQSEAGKAAKERITKTVRDYEGTVETRQKELRKLKEELEKQALVLSEDARSTRERDYQQKLRDFQRFTKDIQDELQQKDAEFTQRILKELIQVIEEMGQKEGFTIILEKTESSILYAGSNIDITDRVIKTYDARHKKEGR